MRLVAVAATCALSACASVQFYAAEDGASGSEGSHCGTPYGWWKAQAQGVTASIAAQPCPQGLCGTLRLVVPATSRASFAGGSMAVADDDSSGSIALVDAATGVGVQPGTPIPSVTAGKAAPDYQFVGTAPRAPRIVLAPPILQIDGRHVALPAAKMVLVERKTSAPCLR